MGVSVSSKPRSSRSYEGRVSITPGQVPAVSELLPLHAASTEVCSVCRGGVGERKRVKEGVQSTPPHPTPPRAVEREGGGLETTDECEVVDLKRLEVKPGERTGSESWGGHKAAGAAPRRRGAPGEIS